MKTTLKLYDKSNDIEILAANAVSKRLASVFDKNGEKNVVIHTFVSPTPFESLIVITQGEFEILRRSVSRAMIQRLDHNGYRNIDALEDPEFTLACDILIQYKNIMGR